MRARSVRGEQQDAWQEDPELEVLQRTTLALANQLQKFIFAQQGVSFKEINHGL
jgi:hypothetical protein